MIKIGTFEIDAVVSITPTHQSEATIHPVQDGAEITDHVINRPLSLEVEGVVSDTPLSHINRPDGSKPSFDAYKYLLQIMQDHTLVTIESGVFPPFKDMLLLTLTPPKDSSTGSSLRFTAIFQQTIFATVDINSIETLVALPRAKNKMDKGEQPASEDAGAADTLGEKEKEKEKDKPGSTLHKLGKRADVQKTIENAGKFFGL